MPALVGIPRPLIAMIHLPPLPGAANYDGSDVRKCAQRAADEARTLADAGFDGVMIQNTHDRPARISAPLGTVGALAAIATAVRDAVQIDIGVNVHKNDAEAALAVAASCGASFVRVKVLIGAVIGPEGIIQGVAERALDVRHEYASGVEIWADLYELTSWPVGTTTVENLADMATRFGMADRLIVTDGTIEASRRAVEQARAGSTLPVLIGGRTTEENIAEALASSDGVIVGTRLRRGGRTDQPLDADAVRDFVRAARAAL